MKKLARGEKGYVLIAALLVLLLLGLVSGPVLSYLVSGLRAGHVFETKAAELYAADAGAEDALCRIRNGQVRLTQCYSTYGPYSIADMNNRSVVVTITLASNTSGRVYNITSTAITTGNSSTTIESFLKFTPGTELNIFSGALSSKGDIAFQGFGCDVTGNIYVGGSITGKPFAQTGGNVTKVGPADFPTREQDVAFAREFEELAKNGTWADNMEIKSDTTLGAPNYTSYITGNLDVAQDVTITLAGVVYVKGWIYTNQNVVVQGSGSIVAEGYIKFWKLASYNVTGDSIIMTLDSKEGIYIKKADSANTLSINALIYAPNGPIKFDKDVSVFGGVVGQSISTAQDGSFTFVPKTSWDFPGGLPGSYRITSYQVNPG